MADRETHVIVGAALAGAKTAEALRVEGFEGRIVLIGAEDEAPYERPPLSKDYLRGESRREEARVHPDGYYGEHDIELRTGTTVERIDPEASEIELAGGERIAFDRLLLATGAEPRRVAVPGAELEGIHYLRDLADSDRLAAELRAGRHLTVIGAGWIGSEVAASARQKGLEVAMVERSELPLAHILGPELGAIYAEIHRDHGVALHTSSRLEAFKGKGRVEHVRLTDGSAIDTDLVVVGVGVRPRVELAERAWLDVDNGVLVDETLRTSSPVIFAAGDVANAFHPFYERRLRVEHWANALHQPETAARSMLGKSAAYERLPYFFSDQYDVGMEYTGFATAWDEVVFRGDPARREFIAFWLTGGRVVAGMNVNVWDVADPIADLIRSRAVVDPARLRDPDVPLEELHADRDGRAHNPA